MRRALVIGASGFLGLNLVDALLARGIAVRATRRPKSITAFLRRRPVELVPGALEDHGALTLAMRDCDVVFVAGAFYPRYSIDRHGSIATGVAQIANVCDAALTAGVPRLVYTSSVGSLGRVPSERAANELDVPHECPPESTYRATKWSMERELERWIERGLDAVTILPGGCLGPLDARVGTSGLLLGVVLNTLPWWLDGTVNVVDVGDVAEAHVEAALRGSAAGRYCVAGHDVQVGALLHKVAARYGGRVPGTPIDVEEARARADVDEVRAAPRRTRVGFPRELVDLIASGQPVSSARACVELGTRFRPIEETLDRAWAWFARHRYLPAVRGLEGAA